MIGLTLKYGTLLTGAPGTPEGAFVDSYGGVDAALRALRDQHVDSIEISMVYTLKSPLSDTMRIISRIQGAGLRVSIHGAIEDLSADAFLIYYAPLFERIFSAQDSLPVTLHGLTDLQLTKRVTQDWSERMLTEWPGVTFAVENQRVRNCRFEHEKDHFRINAIPETLPKLPNIGICWDMGHYAYNTVNLGLPVDTLPSPEALSLVRHTHIHSLKDMDTHHPIDSGAVRTYVRALGSIGYSGLYHIEVKPDKYIGYMDVREGMESSIENLRGFLSED